MAASGSTHSVETFFLRRIQNLVKYLKWRLFTKKFYAKSSTLHDWLCSECASVLNRQKRITYIFYFLFTFQVRLSDGSFVLKKIISLISSINKNILWMWVFNLQITVTTDSYLSLEKFRGYVNRIMLVKGNICFKLTFDLSYNLWEKSDVRFFKSMVCLIGQIQESLRFRTSWVLRVEFSWRSYQNSRLLLTVYCTGYVQRVTAWEESSLLFNIFLTPLYPVSSRPLFLLGIGRIASSLLNTVLKMSYWWKLVG